MHQNDRKGLELLCRYGARGPLSLERLSERDDGRLEYRMKRPAPAHLILKRVDTFLDEPLDAALDRREARGMVSPYLRNFVVARVNYLRFLKGEPPAFEDALEKMLRAAERFDVEKVKKEDLSKMGGAPAEAEA